MYTTMYADNSKAFQLNKAIEPYLLTTSVIWSPGSKAALCTLPYGSCCAQTFQPKPNSVFCNNQVTDKLIIPAALVTNPMRFKQALSFH